MLARPPSSLPYGHTEVCKLLDLNVMFPCTRETCAGDEYHAVIRTQYSCFVKPSGGFGDVNRRLRKHTMTKDECTEINGDDGRSMASAKFGGPARTTFDVVAKPLPE